LFKQFSELFTSVKKLLSSSIQIGTELSKGCDFTILGQFKFKGTGDLFHSFDLGGRSDTRYRKTDINGWTNTLVEEFGFEENLAISNRDHISWNVGGHITSLCFNDWKSSERSISVVFVHLSCTFKQTGVKIEDITWVSFTTWGASEKQRHLTVSDGLLGKIVVDNETVHSVITEVFANSAARIWSEELQWSSVGGSGGNNNGVFKCVTLSEKSNDV